MAAIVDARRCALLALLWTIGSSVISDLASLTSTSLPSPPSFPPSLPPSLPQVKHLLILREQLVPFDIEFAAIEKRLDFKSTRGGEGGEGGRDGGAG